MNNKHVYDDLKQMQSVPLEGKIVMSQLRIRQWYEHFDGNVYLSFSGGKDSTVLKHLIETTSGVHNVPNVFVNTGLEYPEIQKFVRECDNVVIIKPEMRFDEVIKKYGYPVISKEVADAVEDAKRNIPKRKTTDRVKKLTGFYKNTRKDGKRSRYDLSKYEFLIDSDFPISAKCCDVMKKRPIKKYEKESGRKAYIGTMAEESQLRRMSWMRYGCNMFNAKRQMSRPLSFWTEQDILEYLVKFNVPYAKIYGKIKRDNTGKLYTTGEARTGCMFCMFGCHLEKEPNRFQKMKETHPNQYDFCINKMQCGKVLDYINVKY